MHTSVKFGNGPSLGITSAEENRLVKVKVQPESAASDDGLPSNSNEKVGPLFLELYLSTKITPIKRQAIKIQTTITAQSQHRCALSSFKVFSCSAFTASSCTPPASTFLPLLSPLSLFAPDFFELNINDTAHQRNNFITLLARILILPFDGVTDAALVFDVFLTIDFFLTGGVTAPGVPPVLAVLLLPSDSVNTILA
uniref:Uncharacterized protein n=1 Tax=Romanomermis culicivorax TaxID=13658 RepID=A0A915JWD4_ROMCU